MLSSLTHRINIYDIYLCFHLFPLHRDPKDLHLETLWGMNEKEMNPIDRCKGTSDMERLPFPLIPNDCLMKLVQPSCTFDWLYGKRVEAKEIICGTPFPVFLLPPIWREFKLIKRWNIEAHKDVSKEKEFILGLLQNINIKP